MLEKERIDHNGLSDKTVPMPEWEDKLRREYVEAAHEGLVDTLFDYTTRRTDYALGHGSYSDKELDKQFEEDFLNKGWWTDYIQSYMEEAHKKFFKDWVHPMDIIMGLD